ncbi:protein kinase domain-containing protein [Listeria rustica]|uniref:non-specific serine/threonine protein kinase n=1 Tax=Listeria rustica TaxID=2713503 RepID=A0A7W1T991_9LIST|nr:protein kinase [Listeria rustica]MBA3927726.1 protein kinase [Listeria rustica]
MKYWKNTLDEESRWDIIFAVLNGVESAHQESILHRDLKPNNILMVNGDWVVADFGLGKTQSGSSGVNSSVFGYGNVTFAAPEQIDKLKDATVESDVYSLGALIHFVFTGEYINRSNEEFDTFYDGIVATAMSYSSSNRYNDISVLRSEIHKAIEQKKKLTQSPQVDSIATLSEYYIYVKGHWNGNPFSNKIYKVSID